MSKKPETDAFAMPSFDASKVTDQFRDFAEKGLAQSKDAYAKMKTATEEAQKTVEDTFKSVQTAGADVSLKAIAALRANTGSRSVAPRSSGRRQVGFRLR